MIDIRLLRESPDIVRTALARRDAALNRLVDELSELDERRRNNLTLVEPLKAQRNRASDEVARLKKSGADASTLLAELKTLSDDIKVLDQERQEIDARLEEILLRIPNLPLPEVPGGAAENNEVLRAWGEPVRHDFQARPHWELGESLGVLDLPRGATIAGSGFPLFVGAGARLIRALINFMLDVHIREHGYVEVAPPLLVLKETALGTGQLPDLDNQMYVTEDGLYLVPTAEVPVTNIHRGNILAGHDLPRAYVAYTPCFRREAGAHGKDTRGIIRVHQFDKVELVRFVKPENSLDELELLLGHAETMLQKLELPYRVVLLAAGDASFGSAKTYDLEVWAPGVERWLEVSSASLYTDFQARRANIRYRPTPDAKPEFVHTLNASALALPRTIIALLENNQASDGSVRIPQALVPYLGVDRLTPNGGA